MENDDAGRVVPTRHIKITGDLPRWGEKLRTDCAWGTCFVRKKSVTLQGTFGKRWTENRGGEIKKHYKNKKDMRRITLISSLLLCMVTATMAQAKYVFFFIGDGMGPNQVLASEMYLAELSGEIGRRQLLMTQFPYSGQVATFSASNGITDSAAAGTCLATGAKTNNGMIGQTPDGEPVESVATKLRKEGWGIGIMTSVAIDHATPAPHYAHTAKRDDYYNIGVQLAASDFQFFGGSGFHTPLNKNDIHAENLYDLCEANDYTIAGGYEAAKAMGRVDKMILVPEEFAADRTLKGESIPYAIDRKDGDLKLSEIVEVALEQLSGYERFFMMVEGGKIDYACHGRDGATAIKETIDMDEALQVAYEFYEQHPDETLIVVTADHETGGMALGNSHYTLNLQALQYQNCSEWILSDKLAALQQEKGKGLKWADVKALLTENTGLYAQVPVSAEEDAELQAAYKKIVRKHATVKTLYKDVNYLSDKANEILNREAKLGWTSYSHTAAAVPVFAVGVGAEHFTGWHDNTEIAPLLYSATR